MRGGNGPPHSAELGRQASATGRSRALGGPSHKLWALERQVSPETELSQIIQVYVHPNCPQWARKTGPGRAGLRLSQGLVTERHPWEQVWAPGLGGRSSVCRW